MKKVSPANPGFMCGSVLALQLMWPCHQHQQLFQPRAYAETCRETFLFALQVLILANHSQLQARFSHPWLFDPSFHLNLQR